MLGEAPQRSDAERGPDPDLGHALRIEDLTVPGRLEDFNLAARAGRIYALAGQLGCGASDVLRALAGLVPGATGTSSCARSGCHWATRSAAVRAGIAFVSNDRKSEGLFLDKPIAGTWSRPDSPRSQDAAS